MRIGKERNGQINTFLTNPVEKTVANLHGAERRSNERPREHLGAVAGAFLLLLPMHPQKHKEDDRSRYKSYY